MKYKLIVLIGVLCALLCTARADQAKPVTLQVLGETTGLSFSASKSATEIWIQVKVPANIDATTVTPEVQSVLFDRKPDLTSVPRFKLKRPLAASKAEQPSIVLEINEIDHIIPGTYTLTIGFRGGTKPIEPLTLSFERRAAQLAAANKQVIDVTLGAPFSSDAVAPSSIWLPQSDSQSSALRSLTAHAASFTRIDGSNISGDLAPTLPAASVAAGEDLQIKFTPAGFPVGTATGRVFVKSPDLKAPFSFDVEVRTRRSLFWLGITVLVGLLAGYILRVLIQHRVELATAQDKGAELLEKVNLEVLRTPDKTFRSAVNNEIETLKNAVSSAKVVPITEAVTKLETKLKEAVDSLRSRLETARISVKAMAEVATTAGILPALIHDALLPLKDQTEQALDKVQSRDADGAQDIISQCLHAAESGLREVGIIEVSCFGQSAARYAELRPLLDTSKQSTERRDVFAKISGIERLSPPDKLDTAPSIDEYLKAWITAANRRLSGVTELAGYLREDATDLVTLAVSKAGSKPESLAKAIQKVKDSVQSVLDELNEVLAKRTVFVMPQFDDQRVLQAYSELLREVKKLRPGASADVLQMFEASVSAQQYFQALIGLPAPTRQELEEKMELSAGQDKASEAQFVLTATAPIAALAATNATMVPLSLRYSKDIYLDSPQALRAFRARTKQEIAGMLVIQTVSAAIILVGASVALFGERFVGTTAELLGLFFWGFTADLSIAKLTELTGGLKTKTA